jgi:hypothetical protein
MLYVLTAIGAALALLVTPLGVSRAEEQASEKVAKIKIRGKEMGFVSVSPALVKAFEAANGNKPPETPTAINFNTHVWEYGFTYVSKQAEGKQK